MDYRHLVEGVVYDSAEYGPVQFEKEVPDRNTATGICNKFKILNGHHVYVRPCELDDFFRRDE